MPANLTKVTSPQAAEIARRSKLADEALALVRENTTPGELIELLASRGMLPDAVKFLAQALPKREALWWAAQCVEPTTSGSPDGKAAAALQAVRQWVTAPDEAQRRAAAAAGEAAGYDSPAGCVALGVFLSGGSMAPENVPPVPPPDHLSGDAAGGAILLAAVGQSPEQAPQRLRAFLDLGLKIASGEKSLPN